MPTPSGLALHRDEQLARRDIEVFKHCFHNGNAIR
jgi:hypothetical protein